MEGPITARGGRTAGGAVRDAGVGGEVVARRAPLRAPAPPPAEPRVLLGPGPGPGIVRDLRGRACRGPWHLSFPAGDLVVISGLPGSGKSTLMRRAVPGPRIDSQESRERWARRLPHWVPYVLYRPLVRLAHYAGLRRALRNGTGLVVHDCGTQAWVRRWLVRAAGRRGAALHLVLLDVPPGTALAGQGARGRRVSRYAFLRHRRAVGRLAGALAVGRLPRGCVSAVLLDRPAADGLRTIVFGTAPVRR